MYNKVHMDHEAHSRINKELKKNHLCYVLITCDEPSENGDMNVQMTYEGDAAVASYLLQGAQTYIDECCSGEEDFPRSKIS